MMQSSALVVHGLSRHGLWALECRLSSAARGLSCCMALESSQTRDQAHVACIGRQILIHCTTREVLDSFLISMVVRLCMQAKQDNYNTSFAFRAPSVLMQDLPISLDGRVQLDIYNSVAR